MSEGIKSVVYPASDLAKAMFCKNADGNLIGLLQDA
jgi:hypothetical protein